MLKTVIKQIIWFKIFYKMCARKILISHNTNVCHNTSFICAEALQEVSFHIKSIILELYKCKSLDSLYKQP